MSAVPLHVPPLRPARRRGLARRVAEHLPEKLRTVVTSRMRPTNHADSVLAAELDDTHPGAATSLREGMTETLTVLRLKHATHPRPDVPLDELWRA